jgi:hypothetical protein
MHPRHNAVIAEISESGSGDEMSISRRTIRLAHLVFRFPGVYLAGLAAMSAFGLASADDQIPVGFTADRYNHLWERNPFTLVAPATPQAQASAFDKLVLVSWLKDAGKDVIFVQNTETNETQKITSEPNKNNFRIVEIHPNDNPKLVEAMVSNGSEQGAVKFRFEVPAVGNQPTAPVPLAMGASGQEPPGAVPQPPQNPQVNVPGVPNPNNLQQPQPGQMPQAGVPDSQQQNNPRMPRAAESRRKRVLPGPAPSQPIQMPAPGSGQPIQN